MSFIEIKCKNCGATLPTDNDKLVCKFCGTKYIRNNQSNIDFQIRAGVLEKYTGANVNVVIPKAYNKYLDYQIKTIFDEQEKEEYYSERHIVSLLWHWLDDTMYEIGQVSL